jgi:c(7)-type cytochrome triheme protein
MEPPTPYRYGHVRLENFTGPAGVPPVSFDHWRHRSQFTCRLCHVDVGFAMRAGGTEVSAASNRDGYHCGACHDGKREFRGKALFPACDGSQKIDPTAACARCHRRADGAQARQEYQRSTQRLPKDWAGLVDWEKAELAGLVRPVDFLEGVSVRRSALSNQREITIAARARWVSSVLFSHPKHAIWNGCEVCHPDIFPSTGEAERRYSMLSISGGEACGACHDKVAFPLAACEQCHVKPMR